LLGPEQTEQTREFDMYVDDDVGKQVRSLLETSEFFEEYIFFI